MVNLRFPCNINLAIVPKKKTKEKEYTKISRKCKAIIVKDENGEFKARISLMNKECNPDIITISITPRSFDLKGKTYIFAKKKDKYKHNICIVKDYIDATINPGVNGTYSPIAEGIVCSGFVVRKESILYFDYDDIIAFCPNGAILNNVKIDTSKPLFEDEHNSNKSS